MTNTLGYLTIKEVAEKLNVSIRTLNRWHALRVGPPRCKVGNKVLFRDDALNQWLASHEIQPVRRFA